MQSEVDILEDIANKFSKSKISYMLTSSLALSCYAQLRMTRDVVLVVKLLIETVDKILNAIGNEYYFSYDSIVDAVKNRFMFNLIHLPSSIKVGLLDTETGT